MTRILGRERELDTIRGKIDEVRSGKGSTILIAGEAGVGKTRLAEECIQDVSTKGFKVMKGWCLNNCLTPYMPMRDTLASGGLEHLIALEAPPRLETAFLITPTGILLAKFEREDGRIDSDIFTGMLTAVGAFIKDSIQQMGRLPDGDVSRIGHGNFNISAVHGRVATLAAVCTGRENEALLDDMQQKLAEIEERFGDKIERFDGRVEEVEGTRDILRSLFESEKYEGVDWAKGDPRSRQSGMFENVTMGLTREARKQPLLLFIDDLQWADPSTLMLLHYLARNTRGSRVLLLGTYRTEDTLESWDGKTHPLVEAMQLMGREGLVDRIELKNLGKTAIAEIVAADVGEMEKGSEFVNFVWKETQGNPLFALEVVNLLKSEGALVRKGDGWKLARTLDSIDVPAKIHDVISRRLSRLLKEQRCILEPASVIGDVFSSEVLGKVADVKRIELLKALNEIERSHGLIISMEKRFAFSHVKVRDVLYNGINSELKREYHRIVGDTLEELFGAKDETIAEIAYHHYIACDPAKAVPKLKRAIQLAKGKFANEETIRYCSYALELMAREPEKWMHEMIDILEIMGDVKEIAGRYDEARDAFERIMRASEDPEVKARAHRKIASILSAKGQYDKMLEELEKGKTLVEKTGGAEFGRIIAGIGSFFEHKGEYDRAIVIEEEALGILKRIKGTEKDVADVLHKIGHLYAHKGDYDNGLVFYNKALDEFETIGDLRGSGVVLNSIGSILADRDRHDVALGIFGRCLRTFEKLGEPRSVAIALNNLGIVYKSKCEYDKALANYDRCLETFERIGNPRGIGSSLNNMGIILFTKGRYKGALECYEKALGIFDGMKDKLSIGMMRLNIGLVHLELGSFEKARENIEAAERLSTDIGNKRLLVDAWQGLGELLVRTGHPDEAEEKIAKTIELSKQIGVKETEGISYKLLGMLEMGKGRRDKAERSFETAISILSGAKIRIELANTYLEYGKALKKMGDGAKAKLMLERALETFEGLGLGHKVETIKREMGA